jgi:hypothetical protein
MRLRRLLSTLSCTLALFGSAPAASAAGEHPQIVAQWLTRQLHRKVEASQILVFPEVDNLEGCTVGRPQREPTGTTSLSLHCPAHVLPQLVLLKFPVKFDELSQLTASGSLHKVPPIVRAGAALSADWRTDSLHAQLPVIALDSGAVGGEIRVRIAQTNRIMRARILSAHNVTIVVDGA